MRLHPVIAALRGDPAPQRRAQAAMDAARRVWAANPAVRMPLEQLAAYGGGGDLADLKGLSSVMADATAASAFATGLIDSIGAALRTEPLGLAPFRHQTSDSHVVLELSRAGRAALSLIVYRPVAHSEPQSVCLTSGDRHEICLRGGAEALMVSATGFCERSADLTVAKETVREGWSARFDNARHSKIVTRVDRALVILRLQRDLSEPLPAREYRLEDGDLVHQSAADRGDSRKELALALLGAMGRKDAMPAIADTARSGPTHLRWEAVRQGLALDSGAGFAVLTSIARGPADPLSTAASALRARLLETYPQLSQAQERAACPA